MSEREYELTFELDAPLDDATEDALVETLDVQSSVVCNVQLVTLMVSGSDAVRAAYGAARELTRVLPPSIKIERCVEDLVTRKEIARRSGVTAQAVGQWLRGERHATATVPGPFVVSGVELWLWGEVRDWLMEIGQKTDDSDVSYPTRREYQLINGHIAQMNTWHQISLRLPTAFSAGSETEASPSFSVKSGHVLAEFGLAA